MSGSVLVKQGIELATEFSMVGGICHSSLKGLLLGLLFKMILFFLMASPELIGISYILIRV